MNDEDERVRSLLQPLREQVVRVSIDFGRRVADGIEHMLLEKETTPSIFDLFGEVLFESVNAATDVLERRLEEAAGADDDEEGGSR